MFVVCIRKPACLCCGSPAWHFSQKPYLAHLAGIVHGHEVCHPPPSPLTKARVNLSAAVQRIRLMKEYVILEKDGIPISGMMDVDELEDYLRLKDSRLKMQIAEGRAAYARGDVRELKAENCREKRRKATKS